MGAISARSNTYFKTQLIFETSGSGMFFVYGNRGRNEMIALGEHSITDFRCDELEFGRLSSIKILASTYN